jgi:hypothetical protein
MKQTVGAAQMHDAELRHGDVVEVKSAAEILATLDGEGALDGLPFMPEMVQFCGRRFTVDKRADKICDTVHYTGSRRLPGAVLLGDLRCDGSGHDGCQAECRLFWKEAWLRRANGEAAAPRDGQAAATLTQLTVRSSRRASPADGEEGPRYRCQNTELTQATQHLKLWDPRPYLREYQNGNVPLGRFLRVMGRAAVEEPLRKLGLMPEVHLPGTGTGKEPETALGLQPGEWVRVKSKDEIAATLSAQGRNRGMWFDREMLPYCGMTFQVRRRIRRFIDERVGKMIEFKTEAITLEHAVCSGDRSQRRWFCPRAIYPFWRESWLERVKPPSGGSPPPAT